MLIYIKKKIKQFGGTRIICRQGDRRSVTDLQQLSLETSKSIIINQHYQALSDVPKTLLAINKSRRQRFRELHVVAIVESEEDAELCNIIGGNEVEIIHAKYFLARLEAQTCRQRGLPHVYTELLNFAGDEIYIQEENALVGRNYIEIIKSYHSSSVIGIYDSSDKINLNPSMDTALESGDKIIAISEDDDTVKLAKGNGFEKITSIVNTSYQNKKDVENFLILGLNSQTLIMLKNLDEYVPAGSSVTIISEFECFDKDTYKNFDNLKIDIKQADFRERKYLDTIQYQNFDSVIVQGNDKVEIEEADAMTISTLVHLRDLRKKNDGNFPIITEFFDGKNSELVESVKLDDFIISDSILSMAVAQVSENKLLGEVFRELFQPEGSEIYLKPAGNYVHLDQTINFFTLIDSAANKGETAIGYRMNEFANTPSRFVGFKEMTYGVIINPEKNDTFKLNSYDSVIVLSEM
jgi:K+/H+ antiporter YhaU regulatory subunit KhtT